MITSAAGLATNILLRVATDEVRSEEGGTMIAYYDAVVSTAQMMDAPDISWHSLLAAIQRIAKPMGVTIDERKLRDAWREFKKAGSLVSYKRR